MNTSLAGHPVDSTSPIPLYHQIANVLRSQIVTGLHPPGSQLSTEQQLARTFGVSRITVRQALTILVSWGLIERHRGRGTFVTDDVATDAPPVELHGLLDDIIMQADYAGTVFLDRRTVTARGGIAQALKLPSGDEIVRFRRLRATPNGQPHAWVVNHLRPEIAELIDADQLHDRSLLQMIDQVPGLRLSMGYQTIAASAAHGEPARRLGLAPGSPVLFVERITYGKDSTPVEHVRCHYPGSHHRFGVHLARAGT